MKKIDLWNACEVSLILQGDVIGSSDWIANNISIDSRSIKKGNLFLALKGENNDGHDFISKAFENGAIAAIVEKLPQKSINKNLILVKDTFEALKRLGMSGRKRIEYDVIGITGSAGKTTTIKILSTLLKPSWGEARIDGKVIGYQNADIRPIIGYVPDFMGAYDDMIVSEYLDFFATCYGLGGSKRRQSVKDVLELTDLNYKSDAQVASLSRGMSQRLSIARVLLHDPKVLLLDEPASGLDPRARVEIRALLKELHNMGKTILISSHILHELAELCTSVGIVEQGKLLYSGRVDDILAQASVGTVIQIELTNRHEEGARLLRQLDGITTVEVVEDQGTTRIDVTIDSQSQLDYAELPNRLIAQGFRLKAMQAEPINLETAFMRLTKGLVS